MRDELAVLWRLSDGSRCVLLRDYEHWELRLIERDFVRRSELFTTAKRAHDAAGQWLNDAQITLLKT